MKTLKNILPLMVFLFAVNIVCAVNEMPIMLTLVGEYGDSWYGERLIAMDFNVDGCNDLVVYTRSYGVNQLQAALLYFGNTQMDTIPDFIRQSQFPGQVSRNMFLNAGDVNGDGFEDLLIQENFESSQDSCAMHFFYGGPNTDMEPDFELVVPKYLGTPKIRPLSCIGDVNNDGYDDLGCSVWANDEYDGDFKLAILFGGTWELQIISDIINGSRLHNIEGVGDVNGDDISDFVTGHAQSTPNGVVTSRKLYLGGNPLNTTNPILLYQVMDSNEMHFSAAYGIGDYNADGYDDMVYCNGDSWFDNNKIRLGGADILSTQEITVHSYPSANLLFLGSRQKIAHGDFNGDGYSDLAGSDWRAFTWIGHAGIWLGKANPNGQYDLRISSPPTSPYHQFGWQLAAGDFNGDGYCDLAVSAPQGWGSGNPWYLGYVYIFAGNAQLADTTVANDELVLPPEPEAIKLRFYPNPGSINSGSINYKIEGKLPNPVNEADLTIHNIKGQLVERVSVDIMNLLCGAGTLPTSKLISGVYIITLRVNGVKLNSEKIVIK